jgi:hypothetical protein
MSSSAAIHIVGPTEFDRGTAQTPGSERLAAIAPGLGIASATGPVDPGRKPNVSCERKTSRRKPDVFLPTVFGQASMEQS